MRIYQIVFIVIATIGLLYLCTILSNGFISGNYCTSDSGVPLCH
jgi:hypothetical protein